ncbi:MAG: M56 family metallopeptidase, partial [Rhodothermales bacterium]
LGLVFFVLRLTNGLLTVRGLRRRALPLIDTSDENASIAAIFKALQEKMGIASAPILATSDEIKQPLLIGWLKPMVLIPASIIAGLPANQLESILAHELAHVRRHDYLVLLGQSIVETLFFYHPAVWWVSSRMSIEREYCCDEIAVATVQNKVVYVQALASLETSRLNQPFSLGANGGRLVDRIRQLVNPRQRTRLQVNRTSWITLIVLLFACGSLFAACERVSVDESLPAEELFNQANELARAGQYGAAERTAEVAAEKGSLCAMELLAEMLYPESRPIGLKRGVILPAVKWVGQSERKSRYWANVYVDALAKETNEGNSDAMLLLFYAYDSEMDWRHYIVGEDSTARMLLSRAVKRDNADALLWYALMYLDKDQKEERRRLFKEAALKGSDRAFIFWALHNGDRIEDPVPYFEVGQAAIEREAVGVHEWLGKDLDALEKQVLMGNEEAVAWMVIADSMQLRERLAALPESNPSNVYRHPFCPDAKHWRHPS